MIITPTEVLVADDRRREAPAWAARVHRNTAATQASPSATPRPVGRIRAGLRQVVAALVALASIG